MKRYKEEKPPLQKLLDTIAVCTNDDAYEDLESKHAPYSLDKLWKEHVKRNSDSVD